MTIDWERWEGLMDQELDDVMKGPLIGDGQVMWVGS